MTAINDRLNAVAELGDVVPACVVSLCGEAAAEIARLQAQVDALAVALASAVEAIDLLEDSILGVRRNWTPDGDGYYSLQPHKGEMDRLTKAKKQGEAALTAAGR